MMAALVLADAAPRTKKTSNRVFQGRVHPSAAYVEWLKSFRIDPPLPSNIAWMADHYAKMSRAQRKGLPRPPTLMPAKPMHVRALVYRDADRGDLTGYEQAIGDALEARGVIPNDKWIKSWDGTRLLKDAANPRVELLITTLEDLKCPKTPCCSP